MRGQYTINDHISRTFLPHTDNHTYLTAQAAYGVPTRVQRRTAVEGPLHPCLVPHTTPVSPEQVELELEVIETYSVTMSVV
jgi:hypothetical protein